jgi:hypothetical protein
MQCVFHSHYSCQLWFTGHQKTLIKKLQAVKNEGVKIIAGTFCTAPRDALHKHLRIFPMHICLTILTKLLPYGFIGFPSNPNYYVASAKIGTTQTPKSSSCICGQTNHTHSYIPPSLRLLQATSQQMAPRCSELTVPPWEALGWGLQLAFIPRPISISPQGWCTMIRSLIGFS